jgi:hypothetical protein
VDRQRARPCPPGGDPGGRRLPAALLLAALVVVALVTTSAPSAAATTRPTAVAGVVPTPPLSLLAQTGWVVPGQQVFDLHLQASTSVPAASLGLEVSVYPCLSTISGFDQSLTGGGLGNPISSTSSAIPLGSLPTLPGGGIDLAMPVVVGTGSSSAAASPPAFTIHLVAVGEQCQSYPSGVFPVRVELVDTSGSAVVGSFVTHLVTTAATAASQRLRVAVVLPVQLTVSASHSPSPAALLARPASALAAPSDAAVDAVTGTVDAIAVAQHSSVPVTLQVSGQTVDLLDTPAHQATITQLGQLAATPAEHQLTDAPFTPVDATGLVDAGLGTELALQVERGGGAVAAATGRAAPTATNGLGAWITGDGLDATTVGALSALGYREVVLPSSQLSSTPSDGSTTAPFALAGTRGTQMMAMASDDDLTARFTSDPGDPVLAAHQLAAELAQLYYERPNDISVRAVMAVAPTAWRDDPAFVSALLASLDGNPVVQAVTTAQLFALFPSPAACRSGCHLVATGTSTPPVAAVRAQRTRVDGFAAAAVGQRSLAQQLGDLVLAGETETLRSAQQSAVLANAGAAVDAQLGQVAVEGDQSITLTARSGRIPITVVSNASYPVVASLVLSSDKLLFPNGQTVWSAPWTIHPHSNVYYVNVQSRASGLFRLDVTLHAPDGTLRLATGELSVRSTSSSVVGVVLTVGAVAVLAVWWIRTSLRRKAARRSEEEGDPDGRDGREDVPSTVGAPSDSPPAAS